MALTRAEIELLIKARNEAQGAFDQLNKQVKTVTGESDKASQGMATLEGKTKSGGVAAGAAGVAFGLLAERLGRGLVNAFGETIAAANRLDAGLIGLGAQAKAFGVDIGAAQNAAKSLAADGLMSVGEAAGGLKNLLAAGFGLPEAIKLMEGFKDSAAFGRQGSLEFGQAIVGATEGIKNGNSALVDNAGLTKNLSNILVEAGFAASDLSHVQSDLNVRQALYTGMLKEMNPQLGNTALYLDTAAGKQTQFNSQIEIAQQKIGKALQPALVDLLGTLSPLIQIIGNNAGAFVHLAAAVATIVGPLAAMKAATALGVPSIKDMTAGLTAMKAAASANVGSLGLLKTAGLAAAAAFVGWQIGKLIAELTGLDKAIERAVDKWTGLDAQTEGAKQDVRTRAIRAGADAWISYGDAVKYNQDVMLAHTKVAEDNTAGLRKQLDAKLAIGQIDAAQHNDALIMLAMREREANALKNQISLKESMKGADAEYRKEIEATGVSMATLLANLDQNEDSFKKWAKTVGLSDDTLKRLKDQLKQTEDQKKKNTEAAKHLAEAQKKLNEELESMTGIITQGMLTEKLAKMQQMLDLAGRQGAPALATATRTLWPELEKLAQQAKDSNLQIGNITGTMQLYAQAAGLIITPTRDFSKLMAGLPLSIGSVNTETKALLDTTRQNMQTTKDTAEAFRAFGFTAPADLKKIADAAATNYNLLAASGTASTGQLKKAFRDMTDAQKAASGELPTYWEKNVFPGISRTLGTLQTAVQGTFAQMLLGAKGFGDGFTDIWKSIKASALNILNDILSAFLNSFIKGMLGAMAGQKGAFSAAFSGLMGGGGGAGGIGGLLGIGGGGAAAGAGGIAGVPVLTGAAGLGAAPGVAGAGGAAGGGGGLAGLGLAGIGGGLAAGGAGVGLGLLGQHLFGGAGIKAGGFGAGTGFASGALIGSVVPGIGTIIGGVVGGVAGLLSGLIGKSQGEKVNEARDKFIIQFGGEGTGQGSGFASLAAELAKLSSTVGGGEGGGSLFRNLVQADDIKEFEAAIRAIQAAMQGTEFATIKVNEAAAELTTQRNAAVAAGQAEDAVLQAQAVSYSQLLDQIRTHGIEGPAALQPVMDKLLGMGLLVDADGVKITTLGTTFDHSADKMTDAAGDAAEEVRLLGRTTDDVSRRMARSLDGVEQGFADAANAAGQAADGISDAFGNLDFHIPISMDDIPQAAKGVMADRASLVVFGEGGEAEVGGPKSFFREILQDLSKDGVGIGGGGDVFAPVFQTSTLTPGDTATVMETVVMPKLLEMWQQNRRGSLTNAKKLLGTKG